MADITIEKILTSYSDKLDVEHCATLFKGIQERYKYKGINMSNVTLVLIALMTEASKFDKLTGAEKKEIVTEVLIYMVDEIPSDDVEELKPLLTTMIPVLINNIVDMKKGNIKLSLKKTTKQLLCCLKN